MDTNKKTSTDNNTAEVFDDLLSDSSIQPVSFTDQKLGVFDAESAAKLAAVKENTVEKPRQKFGKRSARRKQQESLDEDISFSVSAPPAQKIQPQAESTPVQQTMTALRPSAVQKRADSKASASRANDSSSSVFHAQLEATEKNKAVDELERATFVKPVAAQTVLSQNSKVTFEDEKPEEEALFTDFREPGSPEEVQDDDNEEIIDPSASLVDDYDYDLYEDKKHYMLSDYPKIEEYLARQSKQGYHYVRHEGKHYYFHHGFPRNYYYQILYFAQEPVQAQWDNWEEKGWHLISRAPAKKKSEAGWFILRNEQQPGEFRQEIENEEEKYRFFRSYSNSCRSTMFLLFIVMVVCGIMAFLQYFYKGYPLGIAFALLLLAISLWVFLIYGRMLRKSNNEVRLLKARLRLASAQNAEDDDTLEENEAELDDDWNQVEKQSRTSQK